MPSRYSGLISYEPDAPSPGLSAPEATTQRRSRYSGLVSLLAPPVPEPEPDLEREEEERRRAAARARLLAAQAGGEEQWEGIESRQESLLGTFARGVAKDVAGPLWRESGRPNASAAPLPASPSIVSEEDRRRKLRESLSREIGERNPYPGEAAFFRDNPNVAGMGAEDDRVVFNPSFAGGPGDRESVGFNERLRIAMDRKNVAVSPFALSDEQRQRLAQWGGAYAEDESLARKTIVARIIADDPSLGPYTDEQERAAREAVDSLLGENSARQRRREEIAAAQTGGEEQFARIEASRREDARRPFYPSEMAGDAVDLARNVGKGLVRTVDQVLSGGQSAIEAAAAKARSVADEASNRLAGDEYLNYLTGREREQLDRAGKNPNAAITAELLRATAEKRMAEAEQQREESAARNPLSWLDRRRVALYGDDTGHRAEVLRESDESQVRLNRDLAPLLENAAARSPRLPKSVMARVQREEGYIPEDFWEGMKTDPFKTLAINGVENIGPLAATMAATYVAGPGAGMATAFSQEAGAAYEEAKSDGASDAEATKAAGLIGAGNMFLEYLPAGKALRRIYSSAPGREIARVAAAVAEQAAAEGITESVQEVNSILVAWATYAEKNGWTWEDTKRVGASFIIGTVLGGGAGSVTAAAPSQAIEGDRPSPLNVSEINLTPEQEAESAASTIRPEPETAPRPEPAAQPRSSRYAGLVEVVEPTPPPAATSSPSPEGGEVVAPRTSPLAGLTPTEVQFGAPPSDQPLPGRRQVEPEAAPTPTPAQERIGSGLSPEAIDSWIDRLGQGKPGLSYGKVDGATSVVYRDPKGKPVAGAVLNADDTATDLLFTDKRRAALGARGAVAVTRELQRRGVLVTEGEVSSDALRGRTRLANEGRQAAPETPRAAPETTAPAPQSAPVPAPQVETPTTTQEAPPAPQEAIPRVIPAERQGLEGRAFTASGTEVPFRWAVVDASELTLSHDTRLQPNAAFPADLQPRQRERAASREQIEGMAQKLEPERLAESPSAAEGAPIVGRDLVVESGNARGISVITAYERGKGEPYRQMIRDRADRYGIKPEALEGMERPVLVRVRQGKADRARLAQEMNEPGAATMSATEKAKQDATRLTPEMLEGLRPTDSGDFNMANSPDFIRGFQQNVVPQTERGGMVDERGQLSQQGRDRIRNAVFVAAYGDAEMAARLIEADDAGIKSLGQALFREAPRVAKLRQAFRSGDRNADLDIMPDVMAAARKLDDLRRQGAKVDDYLAQGELLGAELSPEARAVLETVGGPLGKSAKKMADVLRRYQELVDTAGNPKQATLTAVGETPTRRGLWREAVESHERAGQGELFAGAGAAGVADIGGYAPARATTERPRAMPLNLPELVEIAEALGEGKLPSVKKALRAARGMALGQFRAPTGEPQEAGISLRADLPADPAEAKRVLAHEIGHWVDYLPDATLKRGNILGSVATLKRYMRGHLDALPQEVSKLLTPKERARITRQAKRDGVDPAEAIADEAERRDLIGRNQVMDELKALSRKWKPIPEGASAEYLKYRDNPRELYADALSVLLNDPALLEQEAPVFVWSFFGYLNRKPEVAKVYLDIQARIARGEAERLDVVEERVASMIQQGGILRAQELLGRQENVSIGEVARRASHALVDGLIDKNSPLQRRINAARKAGKALSPARNPMYWLEEMAYLNSEAAAYLDRFQQDILYPLRSVGVKDDELGQLLFLRRVAGERSNLWNPLGVDAEVAPELVKRLEGKWGRDKAKLVTESLNQWWRLRQPLIEKLIASGAVTPENAEKMRKNPEYARFFVQSFLEESGGVVKGSALGALKEQIGTLQQIGNPLVETVLTDVALIRLAHRNSTARVLVDFMQGMNPDEVTQAKPGPGGRIEDTSERGKATVRYFVDGKSRAVHMPEEVAQSLDSHLTTNFAYQAWMRFAQNPIRTVFVERNPGWAIWNLVKDSAAFWKNIVKGDPITAGVKTVAYLAKAAPHAWNAVAGKNSEVVREMLEKRMLVQPGERVYRAAEIDEATAINELLQHFHLFSAGQHESPTWQARWGRFLDRFTPFSKKPGEFSERWTKIAGNMYLKDHQQELGLSDQELAHQLRTGVGTPDVYRRGKWFRLYNSILLFSNVNKEGWRASIEAFRRRPIEYSVKTLTQIAAMKAAGFGMAYLLFGDDWEEWWAKVPDHDKRGYGIIPLGETEDGKAVYTRIPFDYTGQVVNAIIQTAFDGKSAREKKDEVGRLFTESFPYSWANFHPYIEVSLATARYGVEGKNPYDAYTGRTVIPGRIFEADKYGKDALTAYSRWMWNQLGGRLLVQWDTEELDRKRGPLEGALHWPIIGPFLGRVYKVSSHGLEEKAWKILEEERGQKGQLSLARDRFILQALDDPAVLESLDSDPVKTRSDLYDAMRALGISYDSRNDLKNRIEELRQRHLADDPLARLATFARSKAARARVLALGKEEEEESEE